MHKDGHVTETTTPPVGMAEAQPKQTEQDSNQENWASRYTGLQRVLAKRDEALHTVTAELDALRAEKEALANEVADYRQSRIDAEEEDKAFAQYEALKARFEPDQTPKPIGNNAPREWFDSPRRMDAPKVDVNDPQQPVGWPI